MPPRTTLHHQLVQIWEELLDARPIGIRDDFFALGGHSLLAVRLVDRIERLSGKRIALSTLFAHATIEGLAEAMLRDEEQASTSLLIEIQPGGDRPAFFFLHGDWLGGGFYCRSLARALGQDQPFYVLQPHGLQGSHIPASIESMAVELVGALRAFQPHGPYLLGGYCNGGLIAYEMAQRLRAQGEEVRLLAMIDTVAASARDRRMGEAISRVGSMARLDLERQLRVFLRVRHVWDGFLKPCLRLRSAGEFTPAQQASARSIASLGQAFTQRRDRVRAARSVVSALFPPAAALREESWAVYRWVVTRYVPRRYPDHLTVVATQGLVDMTLDATLGWQSITGDIESHTLSCSHIESVTSHVELLADCLRAALDRVQLSRTKRPSPEAPLYLQESRELSMTP